VELLIDGSGATQVHTGLPFFDHMLSQLGRHGGFDLTVQAAGDLHVDAHHTVEDVGIVVGEVLAQAMGDKAGIRRFASIALPLDEALVDAALDVSGRPYLAYDVPFAAEVAPLGSPPFAPQLAEEFWRAFATAAGLTLHVRVVAGKNTHHVLEASFKAVARCLRDALRVEGAGVPSTKGTLGTIAVLDYGIGNLASAHKALVHLGAQARLVTRPEDASAAAGVVLPGVGAFGPCAAALRRTGLVDAVTEALRRGTPFLGICVGFQLLYEGSEEAPATEGLGILDGTVRALPEGVKRPQMQWNQLHRRPESASCLLDGLDADPWVYFVHSFSPELTDDVVATCDYGGDVVAAAERGRVWGTQFHPEKSGALGLAILANFVAACGDGRGG
jgi:imidazoleglycerol-phosphate dehydratase